MDETPIWFEMVPKSTVAKLGAKSVTVKTFGTERKRFSLMLTIGDKGQKLPPVIVFKGEKNATHQKRLQSYADSKKYMSFILCQSSGWADHEVFIFWLENVFFNNKIIPNRIHKLLILDRATTHYEENLVEKFKKFNASYILIPPGLTRFMQPLDCSVNGPFKKALIHWDVEYRIDHKNTKKPSYNDLIDAVLENCYSEDKITAEIIFNSFKITGISVALDESEKNKIILHEEVSDSIISPEDFLEDENSPTWEEDAKKVDNKAKNKGNDQKKDKQGLITNYFKKEDDIEMDSDS